MTKFIGNLSHKQRQYLALGFVLLGIMLLLNIGSVLLALIFGAVFLLPGLAFWSVYQSGHNATAPFAIPAWLFFGTGGILIFQSITGYWASWAFVWTLYGVFIGNGIYLMGQRLTDRTLMAVGRGLIIAGGLAFVVLGTLLTMLTSGAFTIIIAVLMIGLGAYLWLANRPDATIVEVPKRKHSDDSVEDNIQQVKVKLSKEQKSA